MKKLYIFIAALLFSFSLKAQIIDFPDPNFKQALLNSGVDSNNDDEIQVSEAQSVTSLNFVLIARNSISSVVGIEYFINLEEFVIFDNLLTEIDVSALPSLTHLDCSYNDITSITLNPGLESLNCVGNDLTSIDLSSLNNLNVLNCNLNDLTSIDVSALTNLNQLHCSNNLLTALDVSTLTNLTVLKCNNNSLSALDISALTNLNYLECNSNQITTLDSSLSPNLLSLKCNNNQLISLEIDGLENLNSIECNNNILTSIDTSTLISLQSLYISDNQLTELDVSQNAMLETLVFNNNQIPIIDLSSNVLLEVLGCSNNLLFELDISINQNLTSLGCSNNQLSELEIMHPSLNSLYCSFNSLTELDISNSQIEDINCSNNQLVYLNVKNGYVNSVIEIAPGVETVFNIQNNPDLIYICTDNEADYYDYPYNELALIQNIVAQNGYTNCHVNTYCTFVPGGDYYAIEGTVQFDLNDNGCDVDDINFTHLNLSITNSSETANIFANDSGNYFIPVAEGSHTITPTLESPEYFSVSPSSITVNFPSDTSPYVQDFCVTANGTYNDLEVAVLPIEVARPGFDTNYKLVYKNKGTTTLSGNVGLIFQDDLMDFVAANPVPDSQASGSLSWNFSDLTPFEVREIPFTMGINAPTDTPPVNGDDVLVFEASVNHSETDETPDDNIAVFNQTVVNSYDPNDKTCLQGDYITPEEVGKYVDYMIRFENTGTASAVNIVVKDDIDITKYDLSTLVPLHASHDYFARVKDQGNEHYIEFIFEDINLPFDDTNNDGYVAFKIKTLETLVLGDSFDNNAEIYFDYNFPIITDEATTTVAALSVDEFGIADNSVVLYPNPTTNILNLESKQPIEHVTIFDISGRMIQEIAIVGAKNNMTISTENLTTGTYFVKLQTALGETVRKVIKD
ncbi:T9SS C-terminal target domain-containing protein [Hanstruepera neustonica]|uniref:T9SS C-terminal target domain-containing protein n=1 Tax=Hanstruepera neustonica TaxID=1445657 RepID=A0A2K1E4A0_9FLAO|nr:T9SS type A sorting domain-containing protein [Hanstruepera neustonica]PNQ75093.1 T9SS C-terminal target domain-containing protein [Hanstruepera neustonica]